MKFRFILLLVCFFNQCLFATEVKVLTLNTWMLRLNLNKYRIPFIGVDLAKDVDLRIKIILDKVSKMKPDLILFQEVWSLGIRNQFINGFKKLGYPHYVFSNNAFPFGNGLLIISRYELKFLDLMSFSKQTTWDEQLTKKGALLAQMKVPAETSDQEVWVNVVNVHAGAAPFDTQKREFTQIYEAIKLSQLKEVVAWMKAKIDTGEFGPLWILGGDLNSHYAKRDFLTKDEEGNYPKNGIDLNEPTPEYELFTSNAQSGLGLLDAYRAVNTEALASAGFTFDTDNNPYTSGGHYGNLPSETVDYIFINDSAFQVLEAQRVLDRPVAIDHGKVHNKPVEESIYPSDHYGILGKLRIRPSV